MLLTPAAIAMIVSVPTDFLPDESTDVQEPLVASSLMTESSMGPPELVRQPPIRRINNRREIGSTVFVQMSKSLAVRSHLDEHTCGELLFSANEDCATSAQVNSLRSRTVESSYLEKLGAMRLCELNGSTELVSLVSLPEQGCCRAFTICHKDSVRTPLVQPWV